MQSLIMQIMFKKYDNVHGSISQPLTDQDVPMASDLTPPSLKLLIPAATGNIYVAC